MFRISIIVFLFFIINVRDVEANKLYAAPAFETINVNGKIEFSGFYTNLGIESVSYTHLTLPTTPYV